MEGLEFDLNSNVYREKYERVSCLEIICRRKEVKFDILDI